MTRYIDDLPPIVQSRILIADEVLSDAVGRPVQFAFHVFGDAFVYPHDKPHVVLEVEALEELDDAAFRQLVEDLVRDL